MLLTHLSCVPVAVGVIEECNIDDLISLVSYVLSNTEASIDLRVSALGMSFNQNIWMNR